MAAKPRNRFVDFFQYVGLRLVATALLCFPVNLNMATARLLGSFWFTVNKRHRQRILGNLRRSFPGWSEAEYRRLGRISMQGFPMLGVEVFFTPRLIRLDTWHRYIRLNNFQEALNLLIRQKGVIMITGHYGNWEMAGYIMATLGFETTSVARPLDNPYVNKWLLGVRERLGQRVVDKKGATTVVGPVLDKGGTVAFIADQNAGTKGLFVDFFGRKASTYKSIGLLAMQYELPVVIGYARRVGGKFLFDVGVQDIIYPADWKGQDDPLRYITQRYTKGIEDVVRAEPGQYLWVHRRWKTRPKGEAPETFD